MPIQALVRSAALLEAVVIEMAGGKSFHEVVEAVGLDHLRAASRGIEVWREHLGIALGGADSE